MEACFLCGSENKEVYAEKNDFHYFRCNNCGLITIDRIPENLSDYYSPGYFTGDLKLDGYLDYETEKKMALGTFEKYLDLIGKNIGNAGRLFEVGCATGCFLELAGARGWTAQGIDISGYAVAEARKKGLKAECSNLENFSGNAGGADAVVMFDVVEHLTNPNLGLQKIYSMLNAGGVVAFATPDAGSLWARVWNNKWHALVPPQHINIFSLKNIKKLLAQNGFTVVHAGHYGKRFSLPYIFRLLHTWLKIELMARTASWCGRSSVLKNISIPINVGDTMFVVAKKEK
jgi:SAM-dependent methyltransferase